MSGMTLRRVRDTDALAFYRWWAHTETTRFNSRPRPDLSWDEHVKWFVENFDNPLWLVGEVDGEPIGAARIDVEGATRWISIVVAPECRSKGCGRRLIMAVTARSAKPVLARIHALNMPSQKAFEHAGYRLDRTDGVWRIYQCD